MTVVTLRKAATIEKQLLAAAKAIPLTKQVTLSIYRAESVINDIATAKERLGQNIEKASLLIRAAYDVRALISAANSANGVNALLTERAGCEATERYLAAALGNKEAQFSYDEDDDVESDVEVAVKKLAALKTRAENGTDRYNTETLQVNVLDNAVASEPNSYLVAARIRKAAISEELLGINTTSTITLPSYVAELAVEHSLIWQTV